MQSQLQNSRQKVTGSVIFQNVQEFQNFTGTAEAENAKLRSTSHNKPFGVRNRRLTYLLSQKKSDPKFTTTSDLIDSQKVLHTEGETTNDQKLSRDQQSRNEKLKNQNVGLYTQDSQEISAGFLQEDANQKFEYLKLDQGDEVFDQGRKEVITEIEEEDCETPQLSKKRTIILQKPKNL